MYVKKTNRIYIRKVDKNKTKAAKPITQCWLCLTKVGFGVRSIARMNRVKNKNQVRYFLVHQQINCVKRKKKHREVNIAARLLLSEFKTEQRLLMRIDETKHWFNHQDRLRCQAAAIARKHYPRLIQSTHFRIKRNLRTLMAHGHGVGGRLF